MTERNIELPAVYAEYRVWKEQFDAALAPPKDAEKAEELLLGEGFRLLRRMRLRIKADEVAAEALRAVHDELLRVMSCT